MVEGPHSDTRDAVVGGVIGPLEAPLLGLPDERGHNVTELSPEKGRYRTVRYTGYAYAFWRDGTVVINAQVQPVARGRTGLALTTIVRNAVQ